MLIREQKRTNKTTQKDGDPNIRLAEHYKTNNTFEIFGDNCCQGSGWVRFLRNMITYVELYLHCYNFIP